MKLDVLLNFLLHTQFNRNCIFFTITCLFCITNLWIPWKFTMNCCGTGSMGHFISHQYKKVQFSTFVFFILMKLIPHLDYVTMYWKKSFVHFLSDRFSRYRLLKIMNMSKFDGLTNFKSVVLSRLSKIHSWDRCHWKAYEMIFHLIYDMAWTHCLSLQSLQK